MKKLLKIISVNIIVIFIVSILTEAGLLYFDYKRINKDSFKKDEIYTFKNHFNAYKEHFKNPSYLWMNEFRPPAGLEYKDKPSVILLGCSYTYGFKLKNEDSFHSVLSNTMKRTVYNLSIVAASPREMLYVLRNQKILNELLKENDNNNVEYVIYTYMQGHKSRLLADIYKRSPKFKKINNGNNLEYVDASPIENLYLYRKFKIFLASKTFLSDKTFDLLCLYFREIKREIDKLFSNQGKPVKFILLVYEEYNNDWERLEKDGITVIKLNEILDVNIKDTEYQISKTDCHPNEKAWQIIVPALAEKLR
ncbi:hypothetical protein IJ182_03245 [bacterium]|nr:hypothetical protein [bacterium]